MSTVLELPKAVTVPLVQPLVQHDVTLLSPLFVQRLCNGLNECWRAGYDPVVYEAKRTDDVQRVYYAQGRTRPGPIVTYAESAMYSWHFFGLAVDIISRAKQWDFSAEWIHGVATLLKVQGLDWGGDWTRKDLPHFQWGTLKPAPSDRARLLYAQGGVVRVWQEVGAFPAPARAA